MSQETDKPLEGHEYDGIRELDNPLPAWWLMIFFGTIIFAFMYYVHYEFGGGALPAQELQASLQQIQSHHKGGAVFSEDKLSALFSDDAVKQGQQAFTTRCSPCHGAQGQGLIGPNLTDKHWIHGQGSRADILQTISAGVPEKGMPAWGEQISENELIQVSAFVHSIKGTFAPGGKPAQGNEYP